jgi:hypothetical protein
MSNWMAVLLIGYVQCGLLLAWYLFHRRVLAVREEFERGQAERDGSFSGFESELAELRRQIHNLGGLRKRGPLHSESPALKQAKRSGALEMARRGMDVPHIAETLNMRRSEVELLVRLERLQRNAQPPGPDSERHWLETAS